MGEVALPLGGPSFRHLTPALSPFEAEREAARWPSAFEFVARCIIKSVLRGIRGEFPRPWLLRQAGMCAGFARHFPAGQGAAGA